MLVRSVSLVKAGPCVQDVTLVTQGRSLLTDRSNRPRSQTRAYTGSSMCGIAPQSLPLPLRLTALPGKPLTQRCERFHSLCFLRLEIGLGGRLAGKRWGFTQACRKDTLQRAFRNLRVQQVRMGKAEYWVTVQLTADQEEIFDAIGYDRPPKRFTVKRQ